MLVALTGWDQPEDRQLTAEAGFDFHLVKPVDADALRKILDRLTGDRA
jgi:CheY-like chemotaxis protein